MKKIFLGICLVGIAGTGFSQKSKVVSTYNYLKYGDLDKAQTAIDLASKNATTMSSAKTWYYRGQVYQAIMESNKEKYKVLSQQPLIEAANSYFKAFELPTKKIDINDLNSRLNRLSVSAYSFGINSYENKEYTKAINYFEMAEKINKKYGVVDSASIFNIALAAQRGGMKDKALANYKRCGEIGFGGANVFVNLAKIYKQNGDAANRLTALKTGREKYPNNMHLLTAELNIYIEKGEGEKAINSLTEAINKTPENVTFITKRGDINLELANKAEEKGDKELSLKKLANAEADYRKAIEIDPNQFNPQFGLGLMFFNQGVAYNDKIQEILDNTKYAKEKKKADALFVKSLPFLEKAHEIEPNDRSTMQSLKTLYVRVGDTKKYNEIKAELKN